MHPLIFCVLNGGCPFGMASGERCGEMFGLRRKPAFVNYHFSANRSFPFAIFALFMFIFRLHGKT